MSPTSISASTNGSDGPAYGARCEIRVLEERINKRGETELLVKGEYNPEDLNPDIIYALVTKQVFNDKNVLDKCILQVNSPHILRILKMVVGWYPTVGTNFDDPLEMESPFTMFFHHWEELKAYRNTKIDDTARMHLSLLLGYIQGELGYARTQNETMAKKGFINFKFLWTIFKPGELQYISNYGQPRLLKLQKTSYSEDKAGGPYLEVTCSYVDYDGENFGQVMHTLRIYEKIMFGMGNLAQITRLKIYPARFSKDLDGLKQRLVERGRRFVRLDCILVMRYSGKCEYLKVPPNSWYDPDWRACNSVWLPMTESGRVVVDRKTFADDYNDEQVEVLPVEKTQEPHNLRYGVISADGELDLSLCSPFVYGFSIQRKEWCRFYVDNLESVPWKVDAMERLVLPEQQKRILQALVSSHIFPDQARDEVELKGKGLVILLHGTPGSDKTLTAETAAEITHKGLLSVSMGELSGEDYLFEVKLKQLFRLATTWQAVILIDEADVFLEFRESGNGDQAKKNALVAVFLRHLEYFQGIIFLTSNRVQVFDDAIKSRIHLALEYKPPTLSTRILLWRQRLSALDSQSVDLDTSQVLEKLGRVEMNGREITNTLSTALTLARHEGVKLQLKHIDTVVHVWQDFNRSIDHLPDAKRQNSLISGRADSVVIPLDPNSKWIP